MDRDLTMSMQISKTIQTFLMFLTFLHQIRSIEGCLTMDSLRTLASALLLSHVDYGNTALVSLSKAATQSTINTTARLITRVKKYHQNTPVLKELHWPKIDERNEFKTVLQM